MRTIASVVAVGAWLAGCTAAIEIDRDGGRDASWIVVPTPTGSDQPWTPPRPGPEPTLDAAVDVPLRTTWIDVVRVDATMAIDEIPLGVCGMACSRHSECAQWCGSVPAGFTYCCSATVDGICFQQMGSCNGPDTRDGIIEENPIIEDPAED